MPKFVGRPSAKYNSINFDLNAINSAKLTKLNYFAWPKTETHFLKLFKEVMM
jgi:hypothetical protein